MSIRDELKWFVMDAYQGNNQNVDNIIALFREKLLSDKAVEAGNSMLPDYDTDTDASDVITAAFDAITKES